MTSVATTPKVVTSLIPGAVSAAWNFREGVIRIGYYQTAFHLAVQILDARISAVRDQGDTGIGDADRETESIDATVAERLRLTRRIKFACSSEIGYFQNVGGH